MPLSRRREALVRGLATRKGRSRTGLFLVEGVRGVREALGGGTVRFAVCSPRFRATPEGEELIHGLDAAGTDVTWVEDHRLDELSATDSPQGVLLVCREPGHTLEGLLGALLGDTASRLLVLDGVQDPGNVGTLIRAASGFGLDGVVILDGTADPWNPKAVRASAGGVFRIAVVSVSWKDAGPLLAQAHVDVLASATGGIPVGDVEPGRRWALVVGNEGRGIRAEILEAANEVVAVPMSGDVDSLNAGMAGTVLLYALDRTRWG